MRRLEEPSGGDAERVRRQLARALGEPTGEVHVEQIGAVLSWPSRTAWLRPDPVPGVLSVWPMAVVRGSTHRTRWPARLGWPWLSSTMQEPRHVSGWQRL